MTEQGLNEMMDIQTDMTNLISNTLSILGKLRSIVYTAGKDLHITPNKEPYNALRDACIRLAAMHDSSVIVLEDIMKYYNANNTLDDYFRHNIL